MLLALELLDWYAGQDRLVVPFDWDCPNLERQKMVTLSDWAGQVRAIGESEQNLGLMHRDLRLPISYWKLEVEDARLAPVRCAVLVVDVVVQHWRLEEGDLGIASPLRLPHEKPWKLTNPLLMFVG